MIVYRLRPFFAFGMAAVLLAGCGDSEVCGAYNGGNVGLVKSCDTTADGAAADDDRMPEPE